MPRQSRIDAPSALHHIIARGIERKRIFTDGVDRDNFLNRLGNILMETQTACFSWALLPNHFHLLLRTGTTSISTVMRRLLTGYAVSYNFRHRRHGHLFQNRYKSILCQEDSYLLELVRYIHLNPLRAGIVKDLRGLNSYPYCGHSCILGKRTNTWQDKDYILKLFASNKAVAIRRYREFVKKGIEQGKRSDLVGGGLIRSAGGWSAIKELRRIGAYQKGDERILGDSDFVKSLTVTYKLMYVPEVPTILTIILIILGLLFALCGLIGCILPVIPGPSISFLSLIILSYAKNWEPFSSTFLIIMAGLTILVTILDYVVPAGGAKKYGASKWGVVGAMTGMLIGIFMFPPWGMIMGAFMGAFAGELLARKEGRKALRAGFGVFVGIMVGTGLKLAFSGTILFFYLKEMF